MDADLEKQLVYPDLHGRSDLLRVGLGEYNDYLPIFLGDYIDGQPGEREVISMVRDNYDSDRGNALLGNHEIHLITVVNAALTVESGNGDVESAETAIDIWSRARTIGTSVFRSYGVDMNIYRQPQARLLRLYELMQNHGHFDFLCELPMIYEDDNLVAVHAGLTDEALQKQKADLTLAKKQLLKGEIGVEPAQLFSHDLGRIRNAFRATDKVVVTGHTSFREDETTRSSVDGLHIRLGSPVKTEADKTMYAYITQEAKVVPVTC